MKQQPCFFSLPVQKDKRRKRKDGKEEREMREKGSNERSHSLCIVNTVDWGALHVLLFFLPV